MTAHSKPSPASEWFASVSRLHWASIGGAVGTIAGLPAAWNAVARNEYRHHSLEKLLGGKHRGAYLLAALIFSLSFCRDWAVQRAMERNPIPILPPTSTLAKRFGGPNALARGLKAAGAALVAAGSVLVLSSFARLGVTGTYLGDYFGILMSERVTAFPFSWFENPMYLGAVLNFLGGALYKNNAVGVGLTGVVALVYHISTTFFEGPFTAQIYANQGH